MSSGARVGRVFYQQDPQDLARCLLDCVLVRRETDGVRVAGRIVETEAYLGVVDKAAHTFGGRQTARVRSMWGKAGTAYVYQIYGKHHCLNVSATRAGEPTAVLIRALEPTEGEAVMWPRRVKAKRATDLCSGPGKLCAALGIERSRDDGRDLVVDDELWIEGGEALASASVKRGPRVGVDYAEEWAKAPLRFWVDANPHVSRAK